MSIPNTVTRNGNIAFITGLTAALVDPIVISLLRDTLHKGLVTEMSFNSGISAILADNAAMRTEILQLRLDLIDKKNFTDKSLSTPKEKYETVIPEFHDPRFIRNRIEPLDIDNNMNIPNRELKSTDSLDTRSSETSPNNIDAASETLRVDISHDNHIDAIHAATLESSIAQQHIYHRPYDLPPFRAESAAAAAVVAGALSQSKKKRRMSKYDVTLPQNLVVPKLEKPGTPEPHIHGSNRVLVTVCSNVH